MKELLAARKKVKASKPKNFLRTDSNRKKYKNKWRKPRGLHNKRRLGFRGHQKNPSAGYRSPVEVRGLNKQGLKEIIVSNLSDIKNIDGKGTIIIISKSVGLRKRLEILNELKNTNLQVQGITNIEKYITHKQEEIVSRKEASKKREKKKTEKQKEAEKKAAENKDKKGETQEEVKKEILESKPKEDKSQKIPKKATQDTKIGHKQSSVPGTKQ